MTIVTVMISIPQARRAWAIIKEHAPHASYWNNKHKERRVLKWEMLVREAKKVSEELTSWRIGHSIDGAVIRLSVPLDFQAPEPPPAALRAKRAKAADRKAFVAQVKKDFKSLTPNERAKIIYG